MRSSYFVWIGSMTAALVLGCGGDKDTSALFGTGASASSSGQGGAPPSSSTGGRAATGQGSGGEKPGGCNDASECNDNIACTLDVCDRGQCSHPIGPNSGPTACPAGQFCEPQSGCVPSEVCATADQCLQKFGVDACKTHITCDAATALCTYKKLDKDGDGRAPIVCGGDDCDDSSAIIFAGAPEICDGKDNDCDGGLDEEATCPGLEVCKEGACGCPAGSSCGTTGSTGGTSQGSTGPGSTSSASTGGGTVCAHPLCDLGGKLEKGCDPCVTSICATDSYCCTTKWDAQCVEKVKTVCKQTCAGPSCAHSLCTQGDKLDKGCDPCVASVCNADSYCCTKGWDEQCVKKVDSLCNGYCNGTSSSSASGGGCDVQTCTLTCILQQKFGSCQGDVCVCM